MGAKEKRPAMPSLCARGHHTIESDTGREKLPGLVARIIKSLEKKDSPDHVGFPMIPSQESLVEIYKVYLTLLMPGYFGKQAVDRANVEYYIGERVNEFYQALSTQATKCLIHECEGPAKPNCSDCQKKGSEAALKVLEKLPKLRELLAGDIRAAYDGDPAAKSQEEIIFCYPGVRAITVYRLAHVLHKQGIPILPRMLTEYAHTLTGCDIHPGAKIGTNFFIDHATGVVIGETSVIGDRVRLYQGVTLGGANFEVDEEGRLIRDLKRHPTIGSDCVIYAGATILGGQTKVGRGSVIGGNVWLTHSVPAYTKVTANSREQRIIPLNEE
ncbi:MAG: serine O-acetyltransferase EpsC [Planctomycetota bacterium]|jgi:serine O-acetyltransferase